MDTYVEKAWDNVAEEWISISETGRDRHRDFLNTPAFLDFLPSDIDGKKVLDIACGEGTNTRHLARLGCKVTGIDFCKKFIQFAKEKEKDEKLGVDFLLCNAEKTPFEKETFDFITAFMALMDMENPSEVLKEAYRILKQDGFFQFSILHPCFTTPYFKDLTNEGFTYAREVGKYFETGVHKNVFKFKDGKGFETIRHHRTFSQWISIIVNSDFYIECLHEPFADEETIKKCPHMEHTKNVPDIVVIRCRKI